MYSLNCFIHEVEILSRHGGIRFAFTACNRFSELTSRFPCGMEAQDQGGVGGAEQEDEAGLVDSVAHPIIGSRLERGASSVGFGKDCDTVKIGRP